MSPLRVAERLVDVEAGDGISLNGFAVTPEINSITGVVWLHGFGVSYDLPECVRLGRDVASRGVGFVAGNLRGHDGAATAWRLHRGRVETARVGSWWEIFEESALDVAAWMGFARSLGYARLVLAGHSFGALRAVYYISETKSHGVDGLALISPSFGLRHLELKVAETAEAMVKQGRGEELLPAGSWARGFGTDTVSAQTYASWWRVAPTFFGERPSRFAAVDCPLLVAYGSDGDLGGEPEIQYLARLATSVTSFEWKILPGVRHRYAGGEAAIAATMVEWIDHAVT